MQLFCDHLHILVQGLESKTTDCTMRFVVSFEHYNDNEEYEACMLSVRDLYFWQTSD